MAKPNLLLCFDAFGTLFRPKRPIAQQYLEVARQCGLSGLGDDDLSSSFRTAFKDEAGRNPNYGKATGLDATRWWTNVIHKTFTPLIGKDQVLPKDLAPRLLHRFSSDEGYEPEQHLASALRALKRRDSQARFDRVVVGVVTNSDDRVPDVLAAFGLHVSPLRYGSQADPAVLARQDYDIDFHCISYDVGVEKPDRLIFGAAELMLAQIVAARDAEGPAEAKADVESWRKVYVGDERAKDVEGAANAGWTPVLFDPGEQSADVPRLEDCTRTADELFRERTVVRVRSIQSLVSWLTGRA